MNSKNIAKLTGNLVLLLVFALYPMRGSAQITNTVFSDDFSGATIDTSKWAVDSPFFEGGKGDIAPMQHDGIVEFSGTVTEQWWAGATIRALPTFSASAETNIIASVDRVLEGGIGTASRSAFWIMDGTKTKYILFADVRGEEGWRYNRKIGEGGDVPTGGGTIMTAFDGLPWDDGLLHEMKAVANGKTVKLFLDNVMGAEVKFPFNSLIFQIGSYARANGDYAFTQFDNFKVQTVGAEAFSATSATLLSGQTATNLTVRIPPGVNATANVVVRVTSSNPAVAVPVGAVGDTLTLTFPAGGSNEQTLGVRSTGPVGSAQFTLSNDIGMASANTLTVAVIQGPGVRFTDDFSGATIDLNKWVVNQTGFEATGLGTFDATITNSMLLLYGNVDYLNYWPGVSVQTVSNFTATPDLPLSFEVDRVWIDPTRFNWGDPSTAARTGVFITTSNRSAYVFFGQNVGETGWQVNVNPGTPTGSGTALANFTDITDTNSHRMKIVADGSTAEVFLDGVSGGKFDFPVAGEIHFEVGAYARDIEDSVKGVFDNVLIQNVFPSITAAPSAVSTILGVDASFVNVTIPRLLNVANPVAVTVTSENPSVAIPEGAINGKLTLQFEAGKTNAKAFKVITVGPGTAVFKLETDQPVAVANNVNVSVTPAPVVVLSDDFSSATLDSNKWVVDNTPLIAGGTTTFDSGVSITNGTAEIYAMVELADWAGFSVFTKTGYTASSVSPAVFEIDRTKMEYVLIGGTSSKERTGIWIKDDTTNYVFFTELGSWDGTQGGWQYNRVIGQAGDTPVTAAGAGNGVYMTAFNSAGYLDQENHRMRAEANGTSVKLYLDGAFGAEVPFPFSTNITFGFGAFANFANNFGTVVRGYFDNATVLGYPAAPVRPGPLSVARQANGDVVISWPGTGTLQSAGTLTGAGNWSDVTPAPTGNPHTIPAGSLQGMQFFRLRN